MLQFELCIELIKPIICLNSNCNKFVVRETKTSNLRHFHRKFAHSAGPKLIKRSIPEGPDFCKKKKVRIKNRPSKCTLYFFQKSGKKIPIFCILLISHYEILKIAESFHEEEHKSSHKTYVQFLRICDTSKSVRPLRVRAKFDCKYESPIKQIEHMFLNCQYYAANVQANDRLY